jgi:hypothetical protein
MTLVGEGRQVATIWFILLSSLDSSIYHLTTDPQFAHSPMLIHPLQRPGIPYDAFCNNEILLDGVLQKTKSLINLAALIAKDGKIIKGLVILHAGVFFEPNIESLLIC